MRNLQEVSLVHDNGIARPVDYLIKWEDIPAGGGGGGGGERERERG